jgi:hypothetical protein
MTTRRWTPRLAALLILGLVLWLGAQPVAVPAAGAQPLAPTPTRDPLDVDSNPPVALVDPPEPNVPPPNDNFNQALTINALPYGDNQNTVDATTEPEDPLQTLGDCIDRQNGHSVWYRFTASGNTPLTAYTIGSSYDTVLSAHTGSWQMLTEVACNDDINNAQNNLSSKIVITPTADTTYYFDVTAYYATAGGNLLFGLRSAVPPPHDDFDAARAIPTLPYVDSADTFNATAAADDPVLPCTVPAGRNSASVWYRYTASRAGTLVADTLASNYDTVLAAWTGPRGNLANVACSDDQYGQQSLVQFAVSADETYYIEVAAKTGTQADTLALNVRLISPRWETRAPLELARDRLGVASDGLFVYAVGGEYFYTEGPAVYGPTDRVSRYDPATNSWTNLQALPLALQDLQAIYVGGRIYVPAGYAGSGPPFYGAHLAYDVAANTWTNVAPAPWPAGRPALFYSLAANGQGYFLTGGYDGGAILANVWYYQAATNSWTRPAAMPIPRYGHASAVIDGRLYVVAGDDDAYVPGLFSTERYDPFSGSWASVGAQRRDRVYPGAGVVPVGSGPARWYLTGGGFSSYGAVLASTEVFDAATASWQLLPDDYNLNVPRYHLGGTTLAGSVYAVGGFNNGTPGTLTANERLFVGAPTALTVERLDARSEPAPAARPSIALIAGAVAAGVLLAAAGFARATRRRRHTST